MKTHFVSNIAVIGYPNSGKSTFICTMLNTRISAISKVRNTTKTVIRGILNYDGKQYIFHDTPGIVLNTSHKQFLQKAYGTIKQCDLTIMIINIAKKTIYLDLKLLNHIANYSDTIIVILSKIDKVKKNNILPIINRIKNYQKVIEIIPLVLTKNTYRDEIIEILKNFTKIDQVLYDTRTISQSDLTLEKHLEELIREAFFKIYKDEIPHTIIIKNISYKNHHLSFNIISKNNSQKKLIIGQKGSKIQRLRKMILILSKEYHVNVKTLTIKVL